MKRVITLFVAAAVAMLTIAASGTEHRRGVVDRLDHYSTGFPLEGAHQKVSCEDCHRNGVFQGTPRRCESCHNTVLAEGKGVRHIPTALSCETCHTVQEWRLSRFDHTDLDAGCVRCHNNFTAPGKNLAHPMTNNVCEDCHGTVHWRLLLPGIPHHALLHRRIRWGIG